MKVKLILSLFIAVVVATGCGSKTESSAAETQPADAAASQAEKPATSPAAVENLTVETAENKLDRDDMLNAIRKELDHLKLPTTFHVKDLKEKDGFAFFLVEVTNADGTPYKTDNPGTEGSEVGGLLQAAASQFICLSSSAFATDVFYWCEWKEYGAPKEIYPTAAGTDAECADVTPKI
jgi:hypothetical protein